MRLKQPARPSPSSSNALLPYACRRLSIGLLVSEPDRLCIRRQGFRCLRHVSESVSLLLERTRDTFLYLGRRRTLGGGREEWGEEDERRVWEEEVGGNGEKRRRDMTGIGCRTKEEESHASGTRRRERIACKIINEGQGRCFVTGQDVRQERPWEGGVCTV